MVLLKPMPCGVANVRDEKEGCGRIKSGFLFSYSSGIWCEFASILIAPALDKSSSPAWMVEYTYCIRVTAPPCATKVRSLRSVALATMPERRRKVRDAQWLKLLSMEKSSPLPIIRRELQPLSSQLPPSARGAFTLIVYG